MNTRPEALHSLSNDSAFSSVGTVDLPVSQSRVRASARPTAADIHPGVPLVAIAGYFAILAIGWLAFVANIDTGIAMAVNTIYFAMFFGVPILMARVGGSPMVRPGLFTFLRGKVATHSGVISGWSALAQVVVVPISLAFGFFAMAVIVHSV